MKLAKANILTFGNGNGKDLEKALSRRLGYRITALFPDGTVLTRDDTTVAINYSDVLSQRVAIINTNASAYVTYSSVNDIPGVTWEQVKDVVMVGKYPAIIRH